MKRGKEPNQEGDSGELCGCNLCSDADVLLALVEEVLGSSGERPLGWEPGCCKNQFLQQ